MLSSRLLEPQELVPIRSSCLPLVGRHVLNLEEPDQRGTAGVSATPQRSREPVILTDGKTLSHYYSGRDFKVTQGARLDSLTCVRFPGEGSLAVDLDHEHRPHAPA